MHLVSTAALVRPPRSALGRVGRDAAYVFAGRLVALGLAVATSVVVARRLGASGLGDYAVAAGVVMVANVATSFGTDMVLVRDIAAHGRFERWGAALVVQLTLSTVAVGVIAVGAGFVSVAHRQAADAARVLSLSLFPAAAFNVATAVVRGVGSMRSYAAIGVGAAAASLGAVALAPRLGGVVALAGWLVAAQVASTTLAWLAAARRAPSLRRRPDLRPSAALALAKDCGSIGALGLLGVAYQRFGLLVVGLSNRPVVAGWLSAATRVADASKTGHVAWFTALFPSLAADANADPDERRARARRARRLSVGLGVVVTIGLVTFGPWLTTTLYGPSFAPSRAAVRVLALAVVPSTVATHQSLALLVARREIVTLRVLAVCAFVLAVLLAVLVPLLGWIGACWSVVLAETVHATLLTRAARRETS